MTQPTTHSSLNGIPATTDTVMLSGSVLPNNQTQQQHTMQSIIQQHQQHQQQQQQQQVQMQGHSLSMTTSFSGHHHDTTRQKIVDIIDQQFDLEILLRHSEGAIIAQELAKAERMLEDLRHAILSGAPYGNSTASRALGAPPTPQNQYASSRQHSRRATAYYGRDTRAPEALFAVRADGQFVRLGCPRCERYDFGSNQGLLNHMRLSHKQVFKNTEEGVRFCGLVVPETDVPADHPCRTRIVFSSLTTGDAGAQSDISKPMIKTYDEDVDLESDDGRRRNTSSDITRQQPRRNSAVSLNSSSNAGTEDESDTSGAASAGEGLGAGKRRRSSLALSVTRPLKSKPSNSKLGQGSDDSDGSEDDSASEVPQRPSAGKGPMRKYGSISQGGTPMFNGNHGGPHSSRFLAVDTSKSGLSMSRTGPTLLYSAPDSRVSSAASSRAGSPSIHPFMSDMSEPSTPVSALPKPAATTIPPALSYAGQASAPVVPTPTMTAATPVISAALNNTGNQPLQPTIISFGASAIQAGLPEPLDTVGSRFYVKRRIVVGNVSKFLPEEKRDPRLREFPYKWMIYVDGTPKPEEITAYISKVEFHLHESYKPNHIVTVTEPPFHLSRYAWGETQIKVKLYFQDPRNKPVEVYHRLALDPTHCGKQVHGRERYVDLELDRNTDFLSISRFQPRSKGTNNGKSGAPANSLVLNSAREVAMADGAEADEQELQNTLSKPSDDATAAANKAGLQSGAGTVDTVRAASLDAAVIVSTPSMMKRHRAKETTLSYCKACGSLWKQHKDGHRGVAETGSEELILLNEENGQRIPHCPHHPRFHAVKDIGEEERSLLSLLIGRSKNKFALDMLKRCGIVDQTGRPLSSQERMMLEQQKQNQVDSTMDLDIGDSEIPNLSPPSPPKNEAQELLQGAKVQQLSEAFQKTEVYKSRRSEIDWVLSVMDELKLKTLSLDGGSNAAVANRGGFLERDQEQELALNTPGLDRVPETLSQRAVVGGLLVQVTKAFLGRILEKSIQIHRTEVEEEKGPESIMMELDELDESADEENKRTGSKKDPASAKVADKLLVPHHVYQALQSNPDELDFLTKQYEDMEGIGEIMVGL
ncbi:YEATS domain-containing protein 2 [Gryganskiella cystojenkinii]|nr:YEATS domain-containing protein 2 [Gryganskiella cystojenkinii]